MLTSGLLIIVLQTAVHQMLPCRAICAATSANRFCQANSITLECFSHPTCRAISKCADVFIKICAQCCGYIAPMSIVVR